MDDEARVGEALTKTIVCALKSVPSLDNNDHWLNPTEVFSTYGTVHKRHDLLNNWPEILVKQ